MSGGTSTGAEAPPPLPGLDPAWSRLVPVQDDSTGREVVHHVLDTGSVLAAAGITAVGTVLAVHGNPTWSYLWRDLLAQSLDRARAGAPAWRVVAVDQLEMGCSERTGAVRGLADRVRDLGGLTTALDLTGPVVALGHDWGGVIVSGWAVAHPDVLAGLVLTNTALDVDADLPLALRAAIAASSAGTERTTAFVDTTLALAHPRLDPAVRAAFRSPYASARRRHGIRDFVADIPSRTSGHRPSRASGHRPSSATGRRLAGAAHPSRAAFEAIAEGVRTLDVPALLLWGPRDPVFQERYLHDLMARLPQAAVHRFEGAGHLLPEDADVAGAVLDWLAAPTSRRGEAVAEAVPGEFRPMWAGLEARSEDDSTALVALSSDGRREVSWRLLARRVREVAAGLVAIGVQPGHRVSLLVPPGPDLTAALYACLRIGATVVVADAGLGVTGLTRAVRGARPQWIIGVPLGLAVARTLHWPGRRIAPAGLAPALRAALGVRWTLPELARLGRGTALPPEPAGDDLAAVLFTSGSTGPAKGVRVTQAGLAGVRDALAGQYAIDGRSGLVTGFAPFALLGPAFGCRTAVPDMDVTHPATLTAPKLADAVQAVDASVVFLSPAALTNVVATAEEGSTAFDGVQVVLSIGAPVGPALLDRAQRVLPNASIRTPYGMTECLMVADVGRETIHEVGQGNGVCVGEPTASARVRIAPIGPDGRPGPRTTTDPEVTGEIEVRAPHMLAGYDRLWRTDRASRAGTAEERWHRTGDVGHLDAAGRVWVEGRLPHVIVAPDGVITPVAVELAAERAGVGRAAAVGVGPRGTQQLVVVAEGLPAGLAPAPLAEAVRREAAHPVAAVLGVPALPTDIRHNAKIDRARMARWATRVLAGERVGKP